MPAIPAGSVSTVGEIQGLYGAYSFPEKLLQKIWLRGDFDRASAVMSDGRRVKIAHPGKWNLLGGPDFTAARLRFGPDFDREIIGDVELHLRAADWDAHGHARDPAYDRVVMHVVLFPLEPGRVTRGVADQLIPVLALLPLLHRALEEFAADEAVENLANRPLSRLPDELGTLPTVELTSLLQRHATSRWNQKVRFAKLRVEKLGWEAACHHVALEVLGYRFNRAPMLRIAGEFPFQNWAARQVDPAVMYASEVDGWSLQGVRPANHPRSRLRQYANWTGQRPDWPARVRELGSHWPETLVNVGTPEVRRLHHFTALRERIAREICGDAIGGTRLDNLICDGLLPLLAAESARDFEGGWYHWFAGDLPPLLTSGLRQLGYFDGRAQPSCHGAAQGLLGWLLAREPSR